MGTGDAFSLSLAWHTSNAHETIAEVVLKSRIQMMLHAFSLPSRHLQEKLVHNTVKLVVIFCAITPPYATVCFSPIYHRRSIMRRRFHAQGCLSLPCPWDIKNLREACSRLVLQSAFNSTPHTDSSFPTANAGMATFPSGTRRNFQFPVPVHE